MEIMEKIAIFITSDNEIVRRIRNYFVMGLGAYAVLLVLYEFVIGANTLPSNSTWRILWILGISSVVYVWFYYAPIVYKNLNQLNDAFENEEYKNFYSSFYNSEFFFTKKPIKYGKFRTIYTILWALFYAAVIFFVLYYLHCKFRSFSNKGCFLFILLGTIGNITLNFSSCYICIMYVFFLRGVSELAYKNYLRYVKEIPSLSHGFQMLLYNTRTMVLYFLLDSVSCTASFFSMWMLVNNHGGLGKDIGIFGMIAFFYIAIFIVGFGLVTWAFIVLGTRAYLYRIHHEWVYRMSATLERDYWMAPYARQRNKIVLAKERLYKDRALQTGWELLLSIAAILPNLVIASNILFG